MAIGFKVHKAPRYTVATKTLRGRWPGDAAMGREFGKLQEWTRERGLKTGKWFFREISGGGMSSGNNRWELGIEVRGGKRVRGEAGVSIKTYPATTVVGVKFDPALVSPELVYSGIEGWMRWTGKARRLKWNGAWREVYEGNPWKSKKAWAGAEIQAPVKK